MKEKFINSDNFNKIEHFNVKGDSIENIFKYIDENDNEMINLGSYINNNDIENINRLINYIKEKNKNIKLLCYIFDSKGNIDNPNFDYSFYDKISDLNYLDVINFANNNGVFGKSIVSGNDIKRILDYLKNSVKDLANCNLSPFEKLIGCYDIVKSYKDYQLDINEKSLHNVHTSRSLPYVLTSNYMVCVGYSNMLDFLLKECNIKSVVYDDDEHSHELNYINIDDEKYDIHGIYKLDSTNDNITDDKILFKGYDHFCADLEKEVTMTLFDKLLLGEVDEVNKKDLIKVIDLLDPELIHYSSYDKINMFYKKYDNHHNKKINENILIRGIVNVEEFILNKKMTEKERIERMLEIFDIRNINGNLIVSDDVIAKRKGFSEKKDEINMNRESSLFDLLSLLSNSDVSLSMNLKNDNCYFEIFNNGNIVAKDNIKWKSFDSVQLFRLFNKIAKQRNENLNLSTNGDENLIINSDNNDYSIVIDGLSVEDRSAIAESILNHNIKLTNKNELNI